MIRRRRPPREIPFNLDCFLDVIANVVGIIIRLILVTWVGSRAYHAVRETLPAAPAPVPVAASATTGACEDAVRKTLPRQRQDLARTEQRLREQQARLGELRNAGVTAARQLAQLGQEEAR